MSRDIRRTRQYLVGPDLHETAGQLRSQHSWIFQILWRPIPIQMISGVVHTEPTSRCHRPSRQRKAPRPCRRIRQLGKAATWPPWNPTLRNKLTGGGISVSDVFSEKGHKERSARSEKPSGRKGFTVDFPVPAPRYIEPPISKSRFPCPILVA